MRKVFSILVLTARAAWSAVAAFATGAITILPAGTLAAFTARTLATGSALALYVSFGLGLKGTHREAVLAGLLIDLDELHLYGIALLETGGLHVFEAVP